MTEQEIKVQVFDLIEKQTILAQHNQQLEQQKQQLLSELNKLRAEKESK